ncbi:MAG: glycerophosphodiester phosphodiesterase [Armatimonadetes bacterium]|nr:glycerophosphodiester phosphodiesterase [Armatimonadota bacterium]
MVWPVIVAHRGYSARAPENTLAALRMAVDAGVRACECDVRRAADGTIVLIHDATVDRTSSGTGPVGAFTAAELSNLDAGSWKSEQFAGEPIPTLVQALQLMHGRGTLVIELKEDGIAEAVAADVRTAGAEREVVVISFSITACSDARRVLPRAPAFWLIGGEKAPDWDAIIDQALEAGLQGLDVYHGLIDEDAATAVHGRGLSLWAWTVNEPKEARRLAALGVSAITTDDPVLIAAGLA